MEFAAQLIAARSVLGWTRKELAEAAGISPDTIRAIERQGGRINCRLTTYHALMGVLEANGLEFFSDPPNRVGISFPINVSDTDGSG